jgi:hypothetical protein
MCTYAHRSYILRTPKQTKFPSADEEVSKLWYIRIMEYYSVAKSEALLTSTITPKIS